MSRPARVLLTTSTFPSGEDDRVTARFVLDLARHLSAHVDVTVLAPAGPGTRPRERWDGVTVMRYRYFAPARLQRLAGGAGALATMRQSPFARAQALPFLLAQWAAVARVVRRERIDLVNSHWIVPQGLAAALWRRRLGFVHVVTAHAADVALLGRLPFGRTLAGFILDRTDLYLPVSHYLARVTEEQVGRAVPHRVIPMGASPAQFQPAGPAANLRRQPGEQVVLFVGKLVPKKGVGVLLEAVGRLRGGGTPMRVAVAGGGPLEEELRRQSARLRLDAACEFLGWIRHEALPGYYRGANVVCLPSVEDQRGETEGTPVVLQEALASGAIVVASEVSGVPEVVEDGRNGWLAPPGDADALARVLDRAVSMREPDLTRMRQAARETALEHAWERVAERYVEAFQEAARRAGPVSRGAVLA
jgi:glycosyltransferase involved in cell wall biosynthesis